MSNRKRSTTGNGTVRGRTDPDAIIRWEREMECLKLRKAGVDFDTIVEKLGYGSRGHAHDMLRKFMYDYPRDDVEAMRDLELLRIEQKMQQLEPDCEAGNARAVEVWNKLSERYSKLLGLDKPERKEITVLTEDVLDAAVRKLEEEIAVQDRQRQDQDAA